MPYVKNPAVLIFLIAVTIAAIAAFVSLQGSLRKTILRMNMRIEPSHALFAGLNLKKLTIIKKQLRILFETNEGKQLEGVHIKLNRKKRMWLLLKEVSVNNIGHCQP